MLVKYIEYIEYIEYIVALVDLLNLLNVCMDRTLRKKIKHFYRTYGAVIHLTVDNLVYNYEYRL